MYISHQPKLCRSFAILHDEEERCTFELYFNLLFACRGARWPRGRVSDSGAKGQGSIYTSVSRVVSLSKTIYSPKCPGNTQEAVIPSQHDLKIVHWDVMHQRKQPFWRTLYHQTTAPLVVYHPQHHLRHHSLPDLDGPASKTLFSRLSERHTEPTSILKIKCGVHT